MIIKKFQSKNNKVYLVKEDKLLKIKKFYSNKQDFEKAIYIDSLNFKFVPKIINSNKKDMIIYFKYINGINFLDLYKSKLLSFDLVDKLFLEIKSLGNFAVNDMNLLNFILSDEDIYFIDLESIDDNYNFIKSINDFILYLLTYDKIDKNYKFDLVNQILRNYKIDKNDYLDAIRRLEKRRGKVKYLDLINQVGKIL